MFGLFKKAISHKDIDIVVGQHVEAYLGTYGQVSAQELLPNFEAMMASLKRWSDEKKLTMWDRSRVCGQVCGFMHGSAKSWGISKNLAEELSSRAQDIIHNNAESAYKTNRSMTSHEDDFDEAEGDFDEAKDAPHLSQSTASHLRYHDHGDGTVTDVNTGLQWMRYTLGQMWKGASCSGEAEKYNWQEALNAADSLNRQGSYASSRNWRVPTIEELETLVYRPSGRGLKDSNLACDGGQEVPTIDPIAFPHTLGTWCFYWSSSSRSDDPVFAWVVSFGYGGRGKVIKTCGDGYVRLVRMGVRGNK